MAKKSNIYHCAMCGQTIEVVGEGAGTLVCCGQDMEMCNANTTDGALEKHVPVVEALENGGIRVTVGSIDHPMIPEHHIEWIEVINNDYVNRKYLKVGEPPVAEFYVSDKPHLEVREYCNLHGLWKK